MDHVHLHATGHARQGCGHSGGPVGTWQRIWTRQDVPQLLPMGSVHAFLPSKTDKNIFKKSSRKKRFLVQGTDVLHSALDLEELGGRQDANDLRWLARSPHDVSSGETRAPTAAGSLSRRQHQHSQHLRLRLLLLRVSERFERGK